MDERDSEAVVVYHSPSRRPCLERALVLEAVGIEYELRLGRRDCTISVQAADEAWARAELDAYAQENRDWQLQTPAMPRQAGSWSGVLTYALVLAAVAVLQQRHVFTGRWLSAGRMNAGRVCDGEWWRTVTALTLHVDVLHLLANLLFGILLGLFAGQLLGPGLAWLSILLAGALGNAINAWVQPAEHNSIGASTAIFAALGILSAYSWKRRQHTERGWTRQLVPIMGGVALLAFTGTGGERTDFIAHLTGFASGLVLGGIYGALGHRLRPNHTVQALLSCAALGMVVLAWILALRA